MGLWELRLGEGRRVLVLLAVLLVNALVLELVDVVATAGFVSQVGPGGLVWLWIVDMLIILATAGAYALIVDRTARLRLLTGMLIALPALYLLLLVVLRQGAPPWLLYPALYLVADQQHAVFPLAFWALVGDLFPPAQGKRLFPLIASGATLGSILGNGLAAGSALLFPAGDVGYLLLLGSGLLLGALALLRLTFRGVTVRVRHARSEGSDLRETVRIGLDYFLHLPALRYMAATMLLMGLCLTILEFHFFAAVDRMAVSDVGALQAFYGVYKVGLIAATLAAQWLVSARLLGRAGPKQSFIALPVAALAASVAALCVPGIGGIAWGRFGARVVQWSWDEPARKVVAGLIPDEKRGRISAFIDSYFYSLATIAGCLLLAALQVAGPWLGDALGAGVHLVLAGGAALAGIGTALKMRAVYDTSLLNWRLARPRRTSTLDGIDL